MVGWQMAVLVVLPFVLLVALSRRYRAMKIRVLQMDRYEARVFALRLYGYRLFFSGVALYVLGWLLLLYFRAS